MRDAFEVGHCLRSIRPSRWLPTFAAVMAGVLLAAPSVAEKWVLVTTPHFDVISDASAKRARRVAAEFEEVRGAIASWFSNVELSSTRLPIFALSGEGAFADFTKRDDAKELGGFFFRSPLGASIAVRLDLETQQAFGVVYHEYFHAATDQGLPGFPLWLNEGLADVFANSSIDKEKLLLGLPNRTYLRLLVNNRLLDLERIVTPDRAAKTYADSDLRSAFYAQSWALAHFMMFEEDGAYWPKLLAYLDRLTRGAPEAKAWQSQLGDRKEIERALWRHITAPRFSYRILEASVTVDRDAYPARELSVAERAAFHGRYLTSIGHPAASEVLTEALAGDASLVAAREALGFVAFRNDDRPAARSHFEAALELDPERPLANLYHARLEMLERKEGWQDRATSSLLRAVQGDPSFAPAYADLARYYQRVDDSAARALSLAQQAVRRAQNDPQLHLSVASLLRQEGENDEASATAAFARHLAFVASVPSASNNVCWSGALQGLADLVLASCEEAVERDPESGAFRDSRAVARALTGNLSGAAADLRLFLESADAAEGKIRKQRQAWLVQLEAGRNPIDDETLEELRRND